MDDKTFTLFWPGNSESKGRDLEITYRWAPPQPTHETERGIELVCPAAFLIVKVKDGLVDVYSDFAPNDIEYFEEMAERHMSRVDELFT